jgi:hypothetical protein
MTIADVVPDQQLFYLRQQSEGEVAVNGLEHVIEGDVSVEAEIIEQPNPEGCVNPGNF